MDSYTDLELLLGGLLLATAIALIILWIKNYAQRNAVVLQPGIDALHVHYYWADLKNIPDKLADFKIEDLLESKQIYTYVVEDTIVLVSKEKSLVETYNLSPAEPDVPSETEPSETGYESKIGVIMPPHGLRKPPGALMAVKISVVQRVERQTRK